MQKYVISHDRPEGMSVTHAQWQRVGWQSPWRGKQLHQPQAEYQGPKPAFALETSPRNWGGGAAIGKGTMDKWHTNNA